MSSTIRNFELLYDAGTKMSPSHQKISGGDRALCKATMLPRKELVCVIKMSTNPADLLGAKIIYKSPHWDYTPLYRRMQPSVTSRSPYSGHKGMHQGLG